MKRRKFILLSAGATMLILAAGSLYLLSFDYIVKKVLHRKLGSIDINPIVIDQFLTDAKTSNLWRKFSRSKKLLISGHELFHGISPLLPYSYKYKQYSDEIFGDFMLATDYFYNREKKIEKIEYLGIRNLYLSPCSNPFSNLYFSNS